MSWSCLYLSLFVCGFVLVWVHNRDDFLQDWEIRKLFIFLLSDRFGIGVAYRGPNLIKTLQWVNINSLLHISNFIFLFHKSKNYSYAKYTNEYLHLLFSDLTLMFSYSTLKIKCSCLINCESTFDIKFRNNGEAEVYTQPFPGTLAKF